MNEDLIRISQLEPYSAEYIATHETELRQKVVEIAKKYIGANYHINGMLPYKATDCHTILIMVFAEARLIKLFQPEFYRPDFSFHTCKETYLEGMKKFAKETKEKNTHTVRKEGCQCQKKKKWQDKKNVLRKKKQKNKGLH